MGRAPNLFGVDFCGRADAPGMALDCADLVDYSEMPTTPDQQRIELVLDSINLRNKAVLHVGVGNSSLARRVAGRCARIDGITVSSREQQKAQQLQLPNYNVVLCNKYSIALPAVLGHNYDLIVDNNLASFACCGFHLLAMFSSYRLLLRRQGMILTHQAGMDWVVQDPRWRLTSDDLGEVAVRFTMSVARLSGDVYAMIKQ